MNTTITIHLAGQLFHMDKHAYDTLKTYLMEIAAYFDTSEIKEELMFDIEGRIAELFSEKMTHERHVIMPQEVASVIEIMGQPKDYQLSDEEEYEEKTDRKNDRSFFRDLDDTVLGGVAAGLAHYFGLQVSWVRLIWLLLAIFSWGGFIILYFALWVFIAPAKTVAEKLAMKGEPVNISTLEKKVKEKINAVKDSIKDVDYKATTEKTRSGLTYFFDRLGHFIQVLIEAVVKLLGAVLVIASFALLFSLTLALFTIGLADIFGYSFSNIENIAEFQYIGYQCHEFPFWVASIPILFLAGIPFTFLALLGKRLLGKSKKSNSSVLLILLGLWVASLLGLIAVVMYYASTNF